MGINYLLYSVVIYLLISLFLPSPTYAENNINLKLSPALITVQAIPPSNPKTPITIENKGNNPEQIQIRLIPFRPSSKEDGQIEYLNPNSIPQSYKKIFEKIHLTDNGIITTNFELGPKQKKELQLQLLTSKEEPTADYYFSVVFSTSPNQSHSSQKTCQNNSNDNNSIPAANPCTSAHSTLSAGIATNVLLSIGPKTNPQGEITEFSSPHFLQSGPVPFTVRVKNSGTHVFKPIGRIFIKNVFGQTIGRIDLEPNNVLSGTSRSLTTSSSSTQKILWPEKFLLGPYTATLNLALSEEGPVYNKSIIFFALPLSLAIGITLGIILLTIILLRIRYKLKNEN